LDVSYAFAPESVSTTTRSTRAPTCELLGEKLAVKGTSWAFFKFFAQVTWSLFSNLHTLPYPALLYPPTAPRQLPLYAGSGHTTTYLAATPTCTREARFFRYRAPQGTSCQGWIADYEPFPVDMFVVLLPSSPRLRASTSSSLAATATLASPL
jgi:hypothetical protein